MNIFRTNKWLMWLLVLFIPVVVVACTESARDGGHSADAVSEPASTTLSDKPEHAKEVKLVGYLIGTAPKGMPEVLEALNAKLKRDINATIELNYIAWSDVASKYPFVLASGENIDFIFAADWNFYISEATKGAFYPLDINMLNKYMPKHMEKLPQDAINAAYVNGHPYMIPTSTPDQKVSLALFRKDVMQQAGLAEISKFSEIEPYLAAVHQLYPDMIPLNLDSQFDLSAPYALLLSEKMAWSGAPFDSGDPLAQGITADNEDPSGRMVSMVEEPVLSIQKFAAGVMKSWYDKGYVNKNPFSNQVRSKDNFCEGKSGIAFGNSNDTMSLIAACKEKGIDVYPFPLLYPSGKVAHTSLLNNGVAIAANSKNPERTLEALDLIMEDPEYVYLTYFGIEGRNYELTADGTIGLPDGVTAQTNTYPPDAAGFWFVNKDLFKPMEIWTDSYLALQNRIKGYLEQATYLNFSFNSDNVKSEVASLKNVSVQYAQPLYIGAVDDIDTAFDTLRSKLKAAGIDIVQAEVEKQGAAFLANKQQKK